MRKKQSANKLKDKPILQINRKNNMYFKEKNKNTSKDAFPFLKWDIKVVDGFQIPVEMSDQRQVETVYQQNGHGYFVENYMVLLNSDLYIYNDKTSTIHQ